MLSFLGTCLATEGLTISSPHGSSSVPVATMSGRNPSDNSKIGGKGPATDSASSGVVVTNVVASVMSLVVVGVCLGICMAFVAVVIRVRHRRKKFYRQTEVRK